MIIIIINTFLYGAFTKLNAPYNDLQTVEDRIKIPILWGIFFLSKVIIFLDSITVWDFEFTVKPDQAQPPRFYQRIYHSKVESIGSCRSQIHLCISVRVIRSSEFPPHEVVMKFLPGQFLWIWFKHLQSNFIHSKICPIPFPNLSPFLLLFLRWSCT